jgi:hypothetical protein
MQNFIKLSFLLLLYSQISSCKENRETKETRLPDIDKLLSQELITLDSIKILGDSVALHSYYTDTSINKKALFGRTDINVPANQIVYITQEALSIGKLTMGKNSVLQLSNSLRYCMLSIDRGFFNDTCFIIFQGLNGTDQGRNPKDPWFGGWWQAPTGEDGQMGVQGLHGTYGQSGIDITIQLGVSNLPNALYIISQGGRGGNGGDGGKGQNGGNRNSPFRTCGKGGHGGNAGNGGNGGNVDIKYYLNNTFDGQILPQSIGGKVGIVGRPGPPGEGGYNGCEWGHWGQVGNSGTKGKDGVTKILKIPKP